MDFADDGDAFAKVKTAKEAGTYIEEEDIWKIVIQILRGLQAMHSKYILHRDIKSANVFLYKSGVAKIGDLNVTIVYAFCPLLNFLCFYPS